MHEFVLCEFADGKDDGKNILPNAHVCGNILFVCVCSLYSLVCVSLCFNFHVVLLSRIIFSYMSEIMNCPIPVLSLLLSTYLHPDLSIFSPFRSTLLSPPLLHGARGCVRYD